MVYPFLCIFAFKLDTMKRLIFEDLLKWKNKPSRKPLIIQGARQVGKTWLMTDFAQQHFKHVAYFNFENTPELQLIFKQGYNIPKILTSLQIILGNKINESNTLIIFDEIQACPEALTSLKYFYEYNPKFFIFAAGSLLGVAIHQGVSFPVGKVEFIHLFPLSFHEFLLAMNKNELLIALQNNDHSLIEIFRNQYIELLKQYFFIGGMPEAVYDFINNNDYNRVRAIQNNILIGYENDFSKYAPIYLLPRIRLVWQSIVGQLAKENSKFIYSILKNGARAKEFELAIEWLKDAGLIHKVCRVNNAGIPLSSYAIWSDFKIYFNDIGLLCAKGALTKNILLKGDDLFVEFKGTISEQFILQQMIFKNQEIFYWSPDLAKSEIDFIIQKNELVIPIEVKAAENVKSRSLRVYVDKYKPKLCIRTSLLGYKNQGWMENIPMYSFLQWLIKKL